MLVILSQTAQLLISESAPLNEIKYPMHITRFNFKESDVQNFHFGFKYFNMTLSAPHRTAIFISFNRGRFTPEIWIQSMDFCFLGCGTTSLGTINWNLMYPDSIVASSSNVGDKVHVFLDYLIRGDEATTLSQHAGHRSSSDTAPHLDLNYNCVSNGLNTHSFNLLTS